MNLGAGAPKARNSFAPDDPAAGNPASQIELPILADQVAAEAAVLLLGDEPKSGRLVNAPRGDEHVVGPQHDAAVSGLPGGEFLAVTLWNSMDAIRQFAGDAVEIAVIEPEARVVLIDFDSFVRHFDLAHSANCDIPKPIGA